MIQKAGIAFSASSVTGSSPALLMSFGTEPNADRCHSLGIWQQLDELQTVMTLGGHNTYHKYAVLIKLRCGNAHRYRG